MPCLVFAVLVLCRGPATEEKESCGRKDENGAGPRQQLDTAVRSRPRSHRTGIATAPLGLGSGPEWLAVPLLQ